MDPVLDRLLQPEILAMLIPIVAILGGVAAGIAKMIITHRERMAYIERGIDPDSVQELSRQGEQPSVSK